MKPIEVLTIGPDYRTLKGGIVSVLRTYATHDDTFTFLPSYSSENNVKNLLAFPLHWIRILGYLARHRGCRVVHIHGASRVSFFRKYLLFVSIRALFCVKIVYHVHGGGYHLFVRDASPVTRRLIRHMIEKSSAVICLSTQWETFFTTHFQSRRIRILNNIIPLPQSAPVPKSDKVTFLFLGRIEKPKGIFDLIEVIAAHRETFAAGTELYVGGDGEVRELERLIAAHDLGTFVHYVGWISGDDKAALLNRADVFILPSYNEGLPISILEVMSYAMPVIATRVGGIPTIVEPGRNGLLIAPGDRAALFDAMQTFIASPELITGYGQHSLALVQDFFPKKVLHDLHAIYREISED